MNKNYDSFINKAVIFGLVVGGFAIAALAVKPSEIKKPEEPQQGLDISTKQAFEFELQKSLNLNHTETITAIELQNATLTRIENAIAELAEVKEKEEEKSEPTPTPTTTVQKPVRASSTRWTVEGQRTYSDSFLAAHLAEDHGFNPDGYSREDMQAIHDNLHNGFSALGTSSVSVTTSPTVRYSTRPTRRVFRAYSTCPTGGCP